jgi:hypothetical protein
MFDEHAPKKSMSVVFKTIGFTLAVFVIGITAVIMAHPSHDEAKVQDTTVKPEWATAMVSFHYQTRDQIVHIAINNAGLPYIIHGSTVFALTHTFWENDLHESNFYIKDYYDTTFDSLVASSPASDLPLVVKGMCTAGVGVLVSSSEALTSSDGDTQVAYDDACATLKKHGISIPETASTQKLPFTVKEVPGDAYHTGQMVIQPQPQ